MIFSYDIRNGGVLKSRTGGLAEGIIIIIIIIIHTCTHTSESADVKVHYSQRRS
jgi:hypothetical protein